LIITSENLEQTVAQKIKYFNDKIYLVSIINTDGSVGLVCYLQDNVWQPFCYQYEQQKFKSKSRNYRELINSIPVLDRDNIANAKGKFYNTFDTPVEVNSEILTTTFEILNSGKDNVLERKTYYLITDVQELERTFNSSIMQCEIINIESIDNVREKPVDESLKYIVKRIFN
jgi:hypothetical protein